MPDRGEPIPEFRTGDEPADVSVEGFGVFAGDPELRQLLQNGDVSTVGEVESIVDGFDEDMKRLLDVTPRDFGPGETFPDVLERYRSETHGDS